MLILVSYFLAGLLYTASPAPGGDVSSGPVRQSLKFGGYTGWGWDENVFWSLTEDPGYLLPPGLAKDRLPPIVSDQFFLFSPFFSYKIIPSHRQTIRLRWTGAHRQYLREKWSLLNNAAAGYDIRVFRKLFADIEIEGISSDRGKFSEERFRSGKSMLTVSWRDPGRYSIRGGYFFRAVFYPDPAREEDGEKKLNLENTAVLGIRWQPFPPLSLESVYKYASVKSNKEFHDHAGHRVFFTGSATLPLEFNFQASCGVVSNLFPRFHLPGEGTPERRRDLLFWYGGTLKWKALDWLSLWASASFEHLQIDFSGEKGHYRRIQAMGGLQINWSRNWAKKTRRNATVRPLGWTPGISPPSSDCPREPCEYVCKGRWVTFRISAQSARKMSLIGDFNNWNEEKNIMTRKGDKWTVTICLPEGRHLYTYKVDGKILKKPPGAKTIVPDGFGGYNGVVIIDSEEE